MYVVVCKNVLTTQYLTWKAVVIVNDWHCKRLHETEVFSAETKTQFLNKCPKLLSNFSSIL